MPSRHSDAAVGEFHTLTDCEGVELDSSVPFRFACCDCGLVHDMVIVSQDGKPVGFAIKRMPEATQERRGALGADFDRWLHHEQTGHDVDSLNKSAIELARDAFSAGVRKSPSANGDALDEQPYCYALETRGEHNGVADVLLDVEYNGADSFSHGRTGGIPLYRRPAPAAGDALDAARWRAFISCARIRPLGSAGLEQPDPNHYAHMGLEIWTVYGRDYRPELLEKMDAENERGRRWLVMFADVARAALAAQVPQQGEA